MESKNQIEIERKYLVEVVGELPSPQTTDIRQTYLLSPSGASRRLRRRVELSLFAKPKYYVTTKRRIGSDRCFEQENEIDERQYRELMRDADPDRISIHKQRTVFYYENQCFELDCFMNPRMEHMLLEIEGAESPESVVMPPCLRVLEDVTGNPFYYNSNIARMASSPGDESIAVEEDVSLLEYNTFGVDVKADCFVVLDNEQNYRDLLRSGLMERLPFFVIGGGSNVVFTGDFHGIVVHPANKGITLLEQRNGECLVEAAAGEVWDSFVDYCISKGWYGLENLAGIPGCVGAAPVQNVGAYGKEAKDFIEEVHCFDVLTGASHWLSREECRFGYRHSVFKEELLNRCLVDRVRFRLSDTFVPKVDYKALAEALQRAGITSPTAAQFADTVRTLRDSKLPNPKQTGSAGSFFKNPVVDAEVYEKIKRDYPDVVAFPVDGGAYKLAAGWLIEHCGWKGRNVGRVGVYEKQALVLVNRGGCSGAEVKALANAIISDVESRFGVRLSPEAIFVNP